MYNRHRCRHCPLFFFLLTCIHCVWKEKVDKKDSSFSQLFCCCWLTVFPIRLTSFTAEREKRACVCPQVFTSFLTFQKEKEENEASAKRSENWREREFSPALDSSPASFFPRIFSLYKFFLLLYTTATLLLLLYSSQHCTRQWTHIPESWVVFVCVSTFFLCQF